MREYYFNINYYFWIRGAYPKIAYHNELLPSRRSHILDTSPIKYKFRNCLYNCLFSLLWGKLKRIQENKALLSLDAWRAQVSYMSYTHIDVNFHTPHHHHHHQLFIKYFNINTISSIEDVIFNHLIFREENRKSLKTLMCEYQIKTEQKSSVLLSEYEV